MIWFFIALVIMIVLVAQYSYIYFSPKENKYWRKLPFLAEYLIKHPECKTADDKNARCYHCQSDKVLFQPLTRHRNTRYKYVCLNCKRMLFKSKFII